jgi:hypothetical protein
MRGEGELGLEEVFVLTCVDSEIIKMYKPRNGTNFELWDKEFSFQMLCLRYQ